MPGFRAVGPETGQRRTRGGAAHRSRSSVGRQRTMSSLPGSRGNRPSAKYYEARHGAKRVKQSYTINGLIGQGQCAFVTAYPCVTFCVVAGISARCRLVQAAHGCMHSTCQYHAAALRHCCSIWAGAIVLCCNALLACQASLVRRGLPAATKRLAHQAEGQISCPTNQVQHSAGTG